MSIRRPAFAALLLDLKTATAVLGFLPLAAARPFLARQESLALSVLRCVAGLRVIGPSHANMLMVDWKTRTAKEMQLAFRAQGVEIAGGRWAIWPTVSRISIGSRKEMEGFIAACDKVLTAGQIRNA